MESDGVFFVHPVGNYGISAFTGQYPAPTQTSVQPTTGLYEFSVKLQDYSLCHLVNSLSEAHKEARVRVKCRKRRGRWAAKRASLRSSASARARVAEWERKLNRLRISLHSFGKSMVSACELYLELSGDFEELIAVLCSKSPLQRPRAVFNLVEIYAITLVRLQQYCAVETNNGCETLICKAVREVLLFWFRDMHRNVAQYDCYWLHTRAVLTHMFRKLVSLERIVAVRHELGSVHNALTVRLLDKKDDKCDLYVCEQIEYFLDVLSQSAASAAFALSSTNVAAISSQLDRIGRRVAMTGGEGKARNTSLTMRLLDKKDNNCDLYVCEQIEYFLDVLSQSAASAACNLISNSV
ncbi:unnamed protein product [Gongylonema pulchrum]|uniref:BZIP domain-containing protein n=1 Tax=Gongylonema pulchrum TaxID=637853 RepID=A0A183DP48_9BILA|nr:unnamed protein product [Gongylonema pulchrum]